MVKSIHYTQYGPITNSGVRAHGDATVRYVSTRDKARNDIHNNWLQIQKLFDLPNGG